MSDDPLNPPGDPLTDAEIVAGLHIALPHAREVAVTENKPNGSFTARVLLPARYGQGRVVIDRLPERLMISDERVYFEGEDLGHMFAISEGVWSWHIHYADDITEEEIRQLVAKRLIRDPVLAAPRRSA